MPLHLNLRRLVFIFAGVFIGATIIFSGLLFIPSEYPNSDSGEITLISKGDSLTSISNDLKNKGIIKSKFIFKVYMKLIGGDRTIRPGNYLFKGNISLARASHRIAGGDYQMDQRMIVIPEGATVEEIALIVQKEHLDFDAQKFIKDSKQYEGYLFPDTYELLESTSTENVLNILRENFDDKTAVIKKEAESLGLDFKNIIILASLIEEEGKTEEDRKIIAGILYKRLESDIPLQVDAGFRYINGKTTKQLTLDDLKLDSPYNTYTNIGLPPTPISNPGLESIRAAIYPTRSDHLYFLTGDDGKMYYSESFEEHVENKKKYLR